MPHLTRRALLGTAAAGSLLLRSAPSFAAEEIVVPNYGSSVSSVPWAVALVKGFFTSEQADVTSIYATQGGTTDIRSMLAGNLPFTVTNLPTLLAANQSGAELRMISQDVCTCANFLWVTLPNSPIKSIRDLKGKTVTFTSPHSTSQALDLLLVQKAGLKKEDVKLISTGAYGVALTALENGGADVALLAEPNYTMAKSRVKVLAWVNDVLPPINSTIGATSLKVMKDKPALLRGILAGRAKAIDYMKANRHDAAVAVSKIFQTEPDILETVMAEMIDHPASDGTPFWGRGNIYPASVDNLLDGLKLTGDAPANANWRALVDQSFLDPSLRVSLT